MKSTFLAMVLFFGHTVFANPVQNCTSTDFKTGATIFASVSEFDALYYVARANSAFWNSTLLCFKLTGDCAGFHTGASEADGSLELNGLEVVGLDIIGIKFNCGKK